MSKMAHSSFFLLISKYILKYVLKIYEMALLLEQYPMEIWANFAPHFETSF